MKYLRQPQRNDDNPYANGGPSDDDAASALSNNIGGKILTPQEIEGAQNTNSEGNNGNSSGGERQNGGENNSEGKNNEGGSANNSEEGNSGNQGNQNSDNNQQNNQGGQSSQPNGQQQRSFEEMLVEKTGGKLKSVDEIENYLKRPDLTNYPNLLKELEWYEKGGDKATLEKIQSLSNLKDMDNRTIVRKALEYDYPELDGKQIDRLMARKYPTLPEGSDLESLTPDQKDLLADTDILLVQDGKAAREKLQTLHDQWSTPPLVSLQEKAITEMKKWHSTVDAGLKDLDVLPVSLNGKEPYNFKLEADDKANLAVQMKKLEGSIWNEIGMDKDGKFSLQKVAEGVLFLTNEKFRNAYISNQKGKGVEEIKKEIHNTKDFRNNGGGSSNDGVPKTVKGTLAEQIAASLEG